MAKYKALMDLPVLGIKTGADVPANAEQKYVDAYLRRGWIKETKDAPKAEKPAAPAASKSRRGRRAKGD